MVSRAEGCQAAGLPRLGLGIALKIEDGSPRPLAAVTLALLRRLCLLPEALEPALARLLIPTVENTCGAVVGEVRPVIAG